MACGFASLQRVFGCLISCLRWEEVLLLPPFLGSLQKEPSALSLPTCQPEPRGCLGQKPPLQTLEIAGRLAPTEAQSGRGGAASSSRSPPSSREGTELPAGRGGVRRALLPLPPDARAGAACACGVVSVCVFHANPPSPNRPPQQFAIPNTDGRWREGERIGATIVILQHPWGWPARGGGGGAERRDSRLRLLEVQVPPPPSAGGSEKAKGGASVPNPQESGSHGD